MLMLDNLSDRFGSWNMSVGIATRLSHHQNVARPTVRPSHPHVEWASRFFPEGKRGRGAVLTTHFHLSPKL